MLEVLWNRQRSRGQKEDKTQPSVPGETDQLDSTGHLEMTESTKIQSLNS